ncbi:aminotransferase class I/II-fold pyridoxal phosphate-dependent enzyme [Dysgonomonas sp. ZJ279]|uniref:aminotransferase class I/II-fold pyridoxal phosphate-dependent enzyme n=1 Tax=Dysgonomonas sp. ZJ279 TaxID=2709796 RepID=UPI0013EA9FC8|nr:aminotransferase class I/II-fold pyridoxal phosphate-dependent enzyme [Dysgonomonas sp. ZJ279]
MLNGHGDDIYSHGKTIVSNFSSNVYNKLDLSLLQAHLCSQINTIHAYPEPDAISLAKLLAQKYNADSNSFCMTNGATEAIYLIAQTYRRAKTTIIIPTFSEYEDACRINKYELSFCEKLENIKPNTQLVWLCNPNNPNGFIYSADYLKQYINEHSDICFVIDQSYEYYTTKDLLSIEEAIEFPNLILLHSMTKQYAIPGLRLGYITACSELIKRIKAYCMPWSVNQLAIEAGKFLLDNDLSSQLDINEYLIECKRLQNELSQIKGLSILPTDTHFFLCKLDNKKASDLKKYLIDNYGILIRDASNFRGLDERYFRIATQTEQENNLLVESIKQWI